MGEGSKGHGDVVNRTAKRPGLVPRPSMPLLVSSVELLLMLFPEPALALPDREKVTPSHSRRNNGWCSSGCDFGCIVVCPKDLVVKLQRRALKLTECL